MADFGGGYGGQALGAPQSCVSPSSGPHRCPLPFAGSAALRQPALPSSGDRLCSPRSVLFIMQVSKYIIYYFSYYYPLFIT